MEGCGIKQSSITSFCLYLAVASRLSETQQRDLWALQAAARGGCGLWTRGGGWAADKGVGCGPGVGVGNRPGVGVGCGGGAGVCVKLS